jgi:hypothetical protein
MMSVIRGFEMLFVGEEDATPAGRRRVLLPPMVMHYQILPSATGMGIGRAPGRYATNTPHEIYAPLDQSDRLIVFLHAAGATPQRYTRFMQHAASLGHHVIGLSYPAPVAPSCEQTELQDGCFGSIRHEVWDGVDRWGGDVDLDSHPEDSLRNRLVHLLQFLHANYPSENWGQYLCGGQLQPLEINWRRITVAGHACGAAYAAFIGMLERVDRVILFSGPSDALDTTPPTPASWLARPSRTPPSRFFGLAHLDDFDAPAGVQRIEKIRAAWVALGMAESGPELIMDRVAAMAPRQRLLSVLTSDIVSSADAHERVVTNETPLSPLGAPLYASAWTYLLGA